MRGGESIWGAFRTAFFLGRIGDKSASGVLRRAMKGGVPESYMGRQRAILLRWYAVAALKLIEIQSRPAQKRHAVITKWLRHCFSSREEHFMARGRLIPWLNELLGEKRNLFYKNLLPSLDDPWKIQDARRAMR
jgi:hypothetical protein